MKLDDVKKLHQKKYRQQLGYYLVEGEHLILELQKAVAAQPLLQKTKLFVTEKYEQWQTPFEKQLVTERQMEKLSDTKTPQGILAVVPLSATCSEPSKLNAAERCVYLHEVQDPGNLGTILRTLAWFGNFRLLLSANSVDPFNPKVVRSSMGAIFHVPMELDVSLESIQQRFQRFAYLDMNGEATHTPGFKAFDCYLFGNEARGVPKEALAHLNAEAFTIPGNGTIESLNLASAVNMCVYELST